MDLIEFLTARLDEDEAVARAAVGVADEPGYLLGREVIVPFPDHVTAGLMADRFASPARVLQEVAAKRALLADHGGPDPEHIYCCTCADEVYPCPPVRYVASVYADHDDYDPAWAHA